MYGWIDLNELATAEQKKELLNIADLLLSKDKECYKLGICLFIYLENFENLANASIKCPNLQIRYDTYIKRYILFKREFNSEKIYAFWYIKECIEDIFKSTRSLWTNLLLNDLIKDVAKQIKISFE